MTLYFSQSVPVASKIRSIVATYFFADSKSKGFFDAMEILTQGFCLLLGSSFRPQRIEGSAGENDAVFFCLAVVIKKNNAVVEQGSNALQANLCPLLPQSFFPVVQLGSKICHVIFHGVEDAVQINIGKACLLTIAAWIEVPTAFRIAHVVLD